MGLPNTENEETKFPNKEKSGTFFTLKALIINHNVGFLFL